MSIENIPKPAGIIKKPEVVLEKSNDIFEFYTGDGTPEDKERYRKMIESMSGISNISDTAEIVDPVPGEPTSIK